MRVFSCSRLWKPERLGEVDTLFGNLCNDVVVHQDLHEVLGKGVWFAIKDASVDKEDKWGWAGLLGGAV